MRLNIWLWLGMLGTACGDDRHRPVDAVVPRDAPGGLPFAELSTVDGYNMASETRIAAAGDDVVVVTTDQAFPSADSFVPPTGADDPAHPFRKVVYATSHDRGVTFSASRLLLDASCTDPLVEASADGSFWAGCNSPFLDVHHADLLHSTDGGDTFTVVASPPIGDKAWLVVDDARQGVWMVGFGAYRLYGFDGSERAAFDGATRSISGAASDTAGLRYFEDDTYQPFTWDGVHPPAADGDPLPAGNQHTIWTTGTISLGATATGTWIVRALHDSIGGSPIVVRVQGAADPGTDVPITTSGAVAFLPAATLDAEGRLHVVWYDSSGPVGRVLYAHSVTSDLVGSYTTPVVVDGNACPGDGWYPYSATVDPPGGRRLREYIGIALTGNRVVISWTHAPDAPSRVRIAHVDL